MFFLFYFLVLNNGIYVTKTDDFNAEDVYGDIEEKRKKNSNNETNFPDI